MGAKRANKQTLAVNQSAFSAMVFQIKKSKFLAASRAIR
jgi:hypothetical protein